MGLNISLFVHGVPMGQKIWGPKGEDQRFISSFYGPKWEVPEVMKVDVMTFGGVTYCYYSFVKGQNVCDSQGRSGSYFALTLRVNAYYADIQNVYNILKAAYDKMCLGLCLAESNNVAKFLIADFQSIDSKLKSIEGSILNYVSKFSLSEDILPLAGIPIGSKNPLQSINLHECTKNTAHEVIKKAGGLLVSPYYLSTTAAKTIAQYKTEMQTAIQNAKQEIQLQNKVSEDKITSITQQSNEKIDSITKKSQEDLRQCREEARLKIEQVKEQNTKEIAAIKESYVDVNLKMDKLKNTIKDKEQEVRELQQLCQKKDRELASNKKSLDNLHQKIDQLESDKKYIRKPDGTIGTMPKPQRINWFVIGAISFFIVLLIVASTVYVMSSLNTQKKEINLLKEQISFINEERNTEYTSEVVTPNVAENSSNEYEIKVDNNGEALSPGGMCMISLIGQDADSLKGKWVSDGFDIPNENLIVDNIIIAKRSSSDTIRDISYMVGDKCIATISVKVNK